MHHLDGSDRHVLLLQMYGTMMEALGPSHWWPAETPFEVCLGAILTQNTNWSNVDRALWNLRQADLLDPERLFAQDEDRVAELIRPAGYFRVKTKRLKNFLFFLRSEARYDLSNLQKQSLEEVRAKLLKVKGIGPETADSILLYALHKPSFVVDAYTTRIMSRHGLVPETIGYERLRSLFMDALPHEVQLFNEYHALLVRLGKKWCKKKSGVCSECPLQGLKQSAQPLAGLNIEV